MASSHGSADCLLGISVGRDTTSDARFPVFPLQGRGASDGCCCRAVGFFLKIREVRGGRPKFGVKHASAARRSSQACSLALSPLGLAWLDLARRCYVDYATSPQLARSTWISGARGARYTNVYTAGLVEIPLQTPASVCTPEGKCRRRLDMIDTSCSLSR